MIEIENISFKYSKKNILNNVSLQINQGEIVNLLGANGCGKSTLIKLILGFYKAQKGTIKLFNKNINSYSRKEIAKYLSYVPQFHNVAFPYSVQDIVIMGKNNMSFWQNYSRQDYESVDYALHTLNIYHLKNEDYTKLSGGQRQLVMVARAMVQNSLFCFMDEPVSSLDYGNQYRLLESVKTFANKGITFIITSHHPDHVKYLGGRAVLMNNGTIFKKGSVDEVLTESSLYELYKVKLNNNGIVYAVD